MTLKGRRIDTHQLLISDRRSQKTMGVEAVNIFRKNNFQLVFETMLKDQ